MKNKKRLSTEYEKKIETASWHKKFSGLIKPIVNIGNNCYINAAL